MPVLPMSFIRSVSPCGSGLACFAARPQLEPQAPPAPLVLVGGTVVDVTNWGRSARDLHDAIVVIRDGSITDVGSRAQSPFPKAHAVIDCTGKFLIPGLIDGFAGMNSQAQANANLYMGVTTVVARADYQRGFIDFDAQPSPTSTPSTPSASPITGACWPAARSGSRAARRRASCRTQPRRHRPPDRRHRASRHARTLLGADLTAANSQWIIAHAHEMGLVTYGDFRRHALPRRRRGRRGRAAAHGPLRAGRDSRRVAASPRRRSRRPRRDHRLRLLRAHPAHRPPPAHLCPLSGRAPRRAHAHLQHLLRGAARPPQSLAGTRRRTSRSGRMYRSH